MGYGWGFSLKDWAEKYGKKGMDKDKLLPKLWGDNFFNAKKKVWTKVETEDSKRGFVQFILDPICNLHKKIMDGDDSWEKLAEKLGITVTPDDKKLSGKPPHTVARTTVSSAWTTRLEGIREKYHSDLM